jgi:hypothetical protein
MELTLLTDEDQGRFDLALEIGAKLKSKAIGKDHLEVHPTNQKLS